MDDVRSNALLAKVPAATKPSTGASAMARPVIDDRGKWFAPHARSRMDATNEGLSMLILRADIVNGEA